MTDTCECECHDQNGLVVFGCHHPVPLIGSKVVGPIERCDACEQYEGDLDAARAVAVAFGGGRVFYEAGPEQQAGEEYVEGEVVEWNGTYTDDMPLIRSETSPWVVLDHPVKEEA